MQNNYQNIGYVVITHALISAINIINVKLKAE